MSYCVNCGVELDATASFCPLCHTPVYNPNQPVDETSPKPFPTERKEVPPVSRIQVAILLTAIFASVGVCCGVLNIFLRTQHTWSLYVIGAVIMLWIWTVPPLLHHKKDTFRLQLFADIMAIAVYISLIAVDLDGWNWYWHLAHHFTLGGCVLVLGYYYGCKKAQHPDFDHLGHRIHWCICRGGRVSVRPFLSRILEPQLVSDRTDGMRHYHHSAHCRAAGAIFAGRGAAAVPYVKRLLCRISPWIYDPGGFHIAYAAPALALIWSITWRIPCHRLKS